MSQKIHIEKLNTKIEFIEVMSKNLSIHTFVRIKFSNKNLMQFISELSSNFLTYFCVGAVIRSRGALLEFKRQSCRSQAIGETFSAKTSHSNELTHYQIC